MMKTKKFPQFKSKLAPLLTAFIKEKNDSGYSYHNETKFLKNFDKFLIDNQLDHGVIDDEVISRWCEKRESEIENSRKYRVDAVRVFVKYLHSLGIEAATPPRFKFVPRQLPYIPSFHELQLFFKYIDSHQGFDFDNRDATVDSFFTIFEAPVLFRFYYCLGLRCSEALHIKLTDFNMETGRVLITHAKADKHRIVYLPSDLLQLTVRYLKTLHKDHHFSEWLFPNRAGDEPIRAHIVSKVFCQAWHNGVQKVIGKAKRPTIHCMRHCFVIHKIAIWSAEGRDVHLLLPYLSKHLGHNSVADTYYYFHQIEHMCPSVRPFLQSRNALLRSAYEFQSD